MKTLCFLHIKKRRPFEHTLKAVLVAEVQIQARAICKNDDFGYF